MLTRLARLAPGPVVRWFARPYVAGGSMDAGLDVAHDRLERFGALATMDLLGEGVTEQFQVVQNVATYERLIDRIGSESRFAEAKTRPSVSVKPSAFTCGERESAFEHIELLARRAHERGVAITIDMEDRPWTDLTLDWAVGLYKQGLDVGTVLQTRLNRTEQDLERIPPGMRLRLVIGIYPEPESVAVLDKRVMKDRMVEYASVLLDRDCRVEFGTHDEPALERFLREVAPKAPDRCEIQMLLGVPRRPFARKLMAGEFGVVVPFRLYVPFAMSWDDATAYLRRRMRESPSMMWLVLRNLGRAKRA
ncbi:MAG: proline dehydrogenase family protein [Planctomycetota bacterium]|nr:proline dehydrogenase family protein [Planctomycetota bacterium]